MRFSRRLLAVAALSLACASGTAPAMAATSSHELSVKHHTVKPKKHPAKTHKPKKHKHTTKKHTAKKAHQADKKDALRNAPPVVAAGASLSPYEVRLLVDVNGARAVAGLPALRAVPGLTDVARRWTLQLAHADALSHNPDLVQDLSSAGAENWRTLAENVGMAGGSNADDVFAAYMASPLHKANILSAQSRWIGIGAVESDDVDGAVTWNTMDFSDSYDSSYGAARTTGVSSVLADTDLSTLASSWNTVLS